MLSFGSRELDVAFGVVGDPIYGKKPKVLGVELKRSLPDWVSAKDVVLKMLDRYDVDGATGYVIEYFGEGLKTLSTMDRHVIANMGTEMGATSTVFPADEEVKRFMDAQDRGDEFTELVADEGAEYDKYEE